MGSKGCVKGRGSKCRIARVQECKVVCKQQFAEPKEGGNLPVIGNHALTKQIN